MKSRSRGFTLTETLVTISIILILGVIAIAGTRAVQRRAQCVVEINAAKNLITAYLSNAAENNGRVLAGYRTDSAATNIHGETLHYPMNARYPWRLAPDVPKMEGVMLYNGNESVMKSSNCDYLVSVRPNLGLNATLVGGYFGSGSPLQPSDRMVEVLGKFYLSSLAESASPERLVVFASARAGADEPGYFEIRPPNLTRPVWSSSEFSRSSAPSDHGFVDFRWSGKSVAAMLGGNVEVLDEKQMRDMRRWSIQADGENDPKFTLRKQ